METLMQKHIKDMRKIQQKVKSLNSHKDLKETILETIEGCIENAVYHDKKKQPDWQSVAEKLAEALEEARKFTIWCEEIIETNDEEIGIYNNLERSVLENSYNALNEYKKLKDRKIKSYE